AEIRISPEAPRDDEQTERHSVHDDDREHQMNRSLDGRREIERAGRVAPSWIRREEPDQNQGAAFNAAYAWIPLLAHAAFEDRSPDEREPEDAGAAHDEVGALDPTAWTEAQGA